MCLPEKYPWYEKVDGPGLAQGDLLDACPVLLPIGSEILDGQPESVSGEVKIYDVVIMSQSCDLEHQKLDLLLVCPHYPLTDLINQNDHFKTKKGKEDLINCRVEGYLPLEKCSIRDHETSIRVVDFRNIFSLPPKFVADLAASRVSRIRLLPPYREYLSQAFARFFMRVVTCPHI